MTVNFTHPVPSGEVNMLGPLGPRVLIEPKAGQRPSTDRVGGGRQPGEWSSLTPAPVIADFGVCCTLEPIALMTEGATTLLKVILPGSHRRPPQRCDDRF